MIESLSIESLETSFLIVLLGLGIFIPLLLYVSEGIERTRYERRLRLNKRKEQENECKHDGNLAVEVHKCISSNFENVDSFYMKTSYFIVEGLTIYIKDSYEKVSAEIVLQETIHLLIYLNAHKIDSYSFWKKIKELTNYSSVLIDMLDEKTLSNVFSYIKSSIISGMIDKKIKIEANFFSQINMERLILEQRNK